MGQDCSQRECNLSIFMCLLCLGLDACECKSHVPFDPFAGETVQSYLHAQSLVGYSRIKESGDGSSGDGSGGDGSGGDGNSGGGSGGGGVNTPHVT